ncbi:MAG: RluA family pseudouridine synthase [Gammaproteobacteria bacterium]|nr:RluA family pseudouridine synthase [Gammaproteobacteria bacterium]
MKRLVRERVVIPESLAGRRLDVALARLLPDYSRSLIKAWIERGQVTEESGDSLRPRSPVQAGQEYEIRGELAAVGSVEPEFVEFDLVHADPDLIVVNKPAGLVVHPGAGNPGGTLQNGLLHRFPELEAVPRFGLVHRLDAGTTGLLIVARTVAAHQRLTGDLQDRRIRREYRAVTRGCPVAGGTMDQPLGRHPRDRLRVAVRPGGRSAVTHYRVLARFPSNALVAVRLETGRTHQIRVHLAHAGYPLVGDSLYSRSRDGFDRPALHAARLGVRHPATGSECNFRAPLPEDMRGLLTRLAGEERDWDGFSWSG